MEEEKEEGKERRHGRKQNCFGGSNCECDIFLFINFQFRVTGHFYNTEEYVYSEGLVRLVQFLCLLLINKAKAKEKTYT